MNLPQKLLRVNSISRIVQRRHYSIITAVNAGGGTNFAGGPLICNTCSCCARSSTSSSTVPLTIPTITTSTRQLSYTHRLSNAVIPPPQDSATVVSEKYPEHITKIVDSISRLTLIEVADLNRLLKMKLNIADAPMMPMGGMAAAPAAPVEEEEEEVVVEQTEFAVHILSFDAAQKIKLIKEVKKLKPDLNLVQAKKFVEVMPAILKEGCDKEEVAAMKTALEAVGAVISVV